ncbi:MAG: lipoyl domain-containing protein [Candidatus Omnitrophica bacterium]|nr:lipoyl domain-containing protein [Candidatus Omnitrophota bacterium]
MGKVTLPNIVTADRYATIAQWFYDEDEYVHIGDTLFEVMVEETTYNIVAEMTGRLQNIRFKEGDVIALTEHVADIAEDI